MATGASNMMPRCVFEGSISSHDNRVERRPYHKKCGCALHNLESICKKSCPQQRYVSFKKKESWTHCSVYTRASKFTSSFPKTSHE
jgi:peptidyl-prolyl cis-trans isomerase B (cyclophilin B)